MAYGRGWDVSTSEQFEENVEEHIGNDEHALEILEGFIWAAYEWETGGLPCQHVIGRMWCGRIFVPIPYLIFFEVNEADQSIVLEILTPAP